MPITITGAKYTQTVTGFSGKTITASAANFSADDFAAQRIIGLWTSGGVYRGLAWVRRRISSTELEVETNFVDKDGAIVIPAVGDQMLVSKNYADLVAAGIVVDNNTVTLTDGLIIGTAGVSNSVCFYDEAKSIDIENDGGTFCYRFLGGLFVHGHLLNYSERTFFNAVSLNSKDGGPSSGPSSGDQLRVDNAAAKVWWLGGVLQFQLTPARLPGGSSGQPAEWQKWWGIETNGDIVTPGGGAPWPSNAQAQQFVNCSSIIGSTNAIGFRVANSDLQGGLCKISGGSVISPFGADADGDYLISAPAGERFLVLDMGTNPAKTAFWRCSENRTQDITINNVISTDYRLGSSANPGSVSNTLATASVNFVDRYSNLVSGTKVVIVDRNSPTIADDGISVSGEDIDLSVRYAGVIGHTVTISETQWDWGAYVYGRNFVGGEFEAVDVALVGGVAKNVSHGATLLQSVDSSITLSKAQAQALPITVGYDGDTLTVTGNGATIRTISARDLYDAVCLFMDANFEGRDIRVSRVGDNIDAVANNIDIVLDFIALTGSITLSSAREVTLLNGSTVSGGIIDINGDSFLAPVGIDSYTVHDTEADSNSNLNPLGGGTGDEISRFTFAAPRIYYVRAIAGGVVFQIQVSVTAAGRTEISLSELAVLQSIKATTAAIKERQGALNRNIQKGSLSIPATEQLTE